MPPPAIPTWERPLHHFNGAQASVGGTSWSAPIWTAFCALLNQGRGSPIGLLNPNIYPLIGTGSFRDITVGSNGVYSAGVGYDEVTGIGVPDVSALLGASSSFPRDVRRERPCRAWERRHDRGTAGHILCRRRRGPSLFLPVAAGAQWLVDLRQPDRRRHLFRIPHVDPCREWYDDGNDRRFVSMRRQQFLGQRDQFARLDADGERGRRDDPCGMAGFGGSRQRHGLGRPVRISGKRPRGQLREPLHLGFLQQYDTQGHTRGRDLDRCRRPRRERQHERPGGNRSFQRHRRRRHRLVRQPVCRRQRKLRDPQDLGLGHGIDLCRSRGRARRARRSGCDGELLRSAESRYRFSGQPLHCGWQGQCDPQGDPRRYGQHPGRSRDFRRPRHLRLRQRNGTGRPVQRPDRDRGGRLWKGLCRGLRQRHDPGHHACRGRDDDRRHSPRAAA